MPCQTISSCLIRSRCVGSPNRLVIQPRVFLRVSHGVEKDELPQVPEDLAYESTVRGRALSPPLRRFLAEEVIKLASAYVLHVSPELVTLRRLWGSKT